MPNVKIKGWSGNEFAYQDIQKLWLPATESTEEAPVLVPYTYGEAVSKTVEPDFSGGDMAVPIADGELVTELAITKPETLIPANVAKNVNIAGVIGTHEGGGGTSGEYDAVADLIIPKVGDEITDLYFDTNISIETPKNGESASAVFVILTATQGNRKIAVRFHDVIDPVDSSFSIEAVKYADGAQTGYDIVYHSWYGWQKTHINLNELMETGNTDPWIVEETKHGIPELFSIFSKAERHYGAPSAKERAMPEFLIQEGEELAQMYVNMHDTGKAIAIGVLPDLYSLSDVDEAMSAEMGITAKYLGLGLYIVNFDESEEFSAMGYAGYALTGGDTAMFFTQECTIEGETYHPGWNFYTEESASQGLIGFDNPVTADYGAALQLFRLVVFDLVPYMFQKLPFSMDLSFLE